MEGTTVPKTSSIKVLGFTFDTLLTSETHIVIVLSHARYRAGQLYHCCYLLTEQDMSTRYKSWIRPILEYGSILYSGAAITYLHCLNGLQSRFE